MRWVTEALAAEHRPHDLALARLVARDDHDTVDRAAFLYDALYAALTAEPQDAPHA